jgi:REP element-mobilizing transposase RayT
MIPATAVNALWPNLVTDCETLRVLAKRIVYIATMGRDRYRFLEPDAPYFLTCTAVKWLPLFAQPANALILLDSLRFLQRERGLLIQGYVIMENHCHLIARGPGIASSINGFKSVTARQMADRMRERSSPALSRLPWYRGRHKRDREHQVWQEGSHTEQIEGETMMRQKLEYIQNHPVSLGYVDDPLCWRYSSARNYAGLDRSSKLAVHLGQPGRGPVALTDRRL